MSSATVDPKRAQIEAIDASAWGMPFRFVQPRNPLFWLYLWAVAAGTARMVNFYDPGIGNYGGALVAGSFMFGLYTIPWALFLHARDRYTGVPMKLLSTGFVWGAVTATFLIALNANTGLLSIYPKLFGQRWAHDWSAAFTAPFTEETAKALGFLVLVGLAPHLIRSAYDAFIIGAVIGLGFEVSEDVLYVFQGAGEHFGTTQSASVIKIVLLRGASGIASHALFSAIFCTGLAWAIGRVAGGRHVARGIALMLFAMLAHGVWDGAAAIGTKLFGDAGIVFLLIVVVVEIVAVLYVARLATAYERRWIHDILAPEVSIGVITSQEVDAVAASAHHERKYVKSINGHRERKTARHVLDATHELAQAIGYARGEETTAVATARAEVSRLRSASDR